jgi:phosphate transport system permease protein
MDVSANEQSLIVHRDWIRPAPATLVAPVPAKPRLDRHFGDRLFSRLVTAGALGLVALLLLIAAFLLIGAWPAIHRFGLSFVYTSAWDPVRDVYGALPVVFGTVVSSLVAMAIAVPLSVGIALFLNEMAPQGLSRVVGFLVEMLAAIPSVVYGLWGIFVLAPWLRTTVEPALNRTFGFLPLFQGTPYGVGMLCAGIILAAMIVPTISSISREVFRAIPRGQREAALALGATRWEMMCLSVLRSAKTGIFGAAILGLGRAVGETMAVTMVIGNRAEIAASLFAPAQTMASVLANEYAEATSDIHLAALVEVGFVLFVVTFLMNAAARLFIWKVTRKIAK